MSYENPPELGPERKEIGTPKPGKNEEDSMIESRDGGIALRLRTRVFSFNERKAILRGSEAVYLVSTPRRLTAFPEMFFPSLVPQLH